MKVETHRLQGVSGLAAGARWEKGGPGSPEGVPGSLRTDQVDLSSRAQEVSALCEMLRGAPAIRSDRVAQLRSQIAAGCYSAPADMIADRLLLGKVLEP